LFPSGLSPQPEGRFALRGQLVGASTGQPVPDVRVLVETNFRPAVPPVVSGQGGRFVFQ
jgi:hypothetical protein